MPKQKTMKIHPLCRMFGQIAPISKTERNEMLESIRDTGIQVPILVNKKGDTILDGATRWTIAYDLKLNLAPDRFEVFESDDEKDIEQVIMARNMHRRHMTDDQRVAVLAKMKVPELKTEAKARQSKAGTFKGKAKLEGKGSVTEQFAKTAGVSKHKAEQLVSAVTTGEIDNVIAGKTKLRAAAKKAPKKRKTAAKEVPFEDGVYKKWVQWLNRFAPPARRDVVKLVHGWTGAKAEAKA
jgi:ParB-like chromosome segregation protein Spo0J